MPAYDKDSMPRDECLQPLNISKAAQEQSKPQHRHYSHGQHVARVGSGLILVVQAMHSIMGRYATHINTMEAVQGGFPLALLSCVTASVVGPFLRIL